MMHYTLSNGELPLLNCSHQVSVTVTTKVVSASAITQHGLSARQSAKRGKLPQHVYYGRKRVGGGGLEWVGDLLSIVS